MKQKNFESLVFEQTKHRNNRPAWKVFRNGRGVTVLLGRVSYLGGEYRFSANDLALFTPSELCELAEFIEKARP